jgi:hypothetical protein
MASATRLSKFHAPQGQAFGMTLPMGCKQWER